MLGHPDCCCCYRPKSRHKLNSKNRRRVAGSCKLPVLPRLQPETVELVRVVPEVAFVRPLELELEPGLELVFVQTISSGLWQSGFRARARVVSEVASADSAAVSVRSPVQPPVCSSPRPEGQRRR